ncbi:phage tail tape measure protein [Streptomyces sp. NPDC051452]|uniref:phage tail tape measure protein n=1 Tax=Streptomyces sp. NPDC051452 TaxID=3365654 RepID=UPI0037B7A383
MASTGIIYTLIARDAASRTFRQVGRAAGGTESTLAKLGKTAKVVGEAVAVGLAAGLAEGAKSAMEFQAEMTRISTQAGATQKDVKLLSKQVLDLGTTTQQGPQHLAESLYHLKSVGMDNVSAMKALKEASDLAAVGHANLEETTNALAGAWRTGIKGATSFHEAVSTVNAIIGAGNMSMDQFNAAIGTGILPSAKTFGLSMKQVGAALALMTDEGIDSASAATRLRMSFSLLGAPSGAAEKQLKKIGLTGLDLAEAMRGPKGLIGAIGLLKEHLDKSGMSASKQSQLLSRAFGGGRSSSGILLMLNNLDVLEKKQEQINRSTGKFDDAVKQQRKTAEAQWHLLTSNLEVMGIRVGTKVLPPVTSFIHFLATDAMPATYRFADAVGKIIPVDRIKSAIGEAKSVVSGFLGGFGGKGGIGDFIGGLTGAKVKAPAVPKSPIDKFPTTVLDTPHLGSAQTSSTRGTGRAMQRLPHYGAGQVAPEAGRLGAPLAPLPHGGSGLSAPLIKMPKVPKAPKSLARQIGEQVRIAFTDGIMHVNWGKFGPVLGAGLGKAFGWIVGHGAELSAKLGKAIGQIDFVDVGKSLGAIALPFAIGFVNNLFQPLFTARFWEKHWLDVILATIAIVPFGKLFGVVGKLFGRIPWGKLGEIFTRIPWGKILPFGEKIGELAPKFFGAIYRFVSRIVSKFGDAFASRFPKVAQWFSDQLLLLPVRLEDLGRALVRKGREMISRLGSAIVDKVPGMGNRFIRAIVKTFGRFTLYQTGLNLAQSLISGAWSKLKSIGSWMKSHLVDPVIRWVKSGFGIASPSKVFTGIGGNLVAGFKNGVLNTAKGIGGWIVSHLVTPVTSRFARAGSWLTGKGSAMVSGFKSGANSIGKSIGGWMTSHVTAPARNAFTRAGTWLISKGSALIAGLKSGVSQRMRGIGSWLKSVVVDPVVYSVKHFFGIKSPSRVFMGIGGHLVTGLIKGMSRTSGAAIAHKVFGSMPKALASIVKKGLVSVSSLPGKALKALGSLGGDVLGMLGLGGGGGGSSANQKIGATLAALRGWSGPQWAALKNLWNGESGWNERALNSSSGAYGIPQSLPASKMASAGADWKTNPATQIKWGLSYIAERYGNPLNAYSQWLARSPHWYAKGTRGAAKGLAWVGEKGAELVNFKGGEDVLNHEDSMAFAKTHGIKLPGYASGTIMNAADRVRRDKEKVEDAKDAVSRAKRRHKGEAAAEKRLQAAQKELKAAEIALRNAQRSAKTSISNSIATGLQKSLATGTSSSIASAIKSLATKLLNAGYNRTAASVEKKGSKLEALATKRASVKAKIAAANQYASDQAGRINDFLSISGTSASNVGDLISQMGGQQKTARGFVSLTKRLKARGASKALLQQLADAGPGSQLATILGGKGVKTQDIAKLNKLVKSGGKLATSFGRSMADMMYDSGKDAGKGFLAGLKSQEKALGKQMASVAKDLVKAIKRALKIKSPSQVFRDEVGKNIVLGMAHGIDMHGHLVGAATQRLANTATGVSIRRRYVPTAGGSNQGQDQLWDRLAAALEAQASRPHEVNGQLVLDSGELIGVIKGTVQPMIRTSENRQAYRARVGRRAGG